MPIAGGVTISPTFPTVTHKVDFTHDPASASFAAATDLSTRVLSFSCTRGRSYEQATVDAGTATYEWQDTDGALDPTNTSSAYYPNVKPFRAVQTQATWSGTTYNIYTGLVERWPMSWDHEFGTVASQCTDIFAVLANKILSVSYEHEVLADSPIELWPLTDPSGSTSAANRVVGGGSLSPAQNIYAGGNYAFGGTALAAAMISASSLDLNTVLTSAAGDDLKGYYFTSSSIPAALSNASALTFEAWVKVDANLAAAMSRQTGAGVPYMVPIIAAVDASGLTQAGLALFYDSGSVRAGWAFDLGNLPFPTPTNLMDTTVNLNDGAAHHIVVTPTKVYIDGVAGSTINPTLPTTTLTTLTVCGQGSSSGSYNKSPNFRGSIQYAAVYGSTLSSTRISVHHAIGATGFADDTADARITRILSYAGWTGPTAFDACSTTLLSINSIDGQTALTAIQDVERSEGGTFYVGKDGTLTYKSRTTRLATTASAYTFGDGVGELPYESVTFDYDPTFIYNDIQVTRDTASPVYAADTTSQGHYGTRTYAKTLNIASDSEAHEAANWLLANYKDPHLRVASITLNPGANAALFPACLNSDIGTRVTVKRRPHGSSNTISGDFFIEQVNHHTDPLTWTTTFVLSPVGLPALIADDATFGTCDTVNVAGY